MVALSAAACAAPRRLATDLVAAFAEAEVRSDTLDLPALAAEPMFERRGWSALEGSGDRRTAWMLGTRSRLRLPFFSTGDKELDLRARAHDSLGPSLPLGLSLNDQPLGSITLTPREQEFRIVLPSRLQVRGDNVLGLAAPRQREPPAGDPDRRPLVAAFSALMVRPVAAAARPASPAVQDGALLLPPSSSVAYYLRMPAGARLSAAVTSGSGGRLFASVEDDASRRPVLDQTAGSRSSRSDADLGPWARAIVRLELANTGSGWLRLTEARVTVPSPRPSASTARAPASRANVVVYLTDTLRADYLGAYGQSAPTSPRFDAFAREAVLFEDAWAQASWTRSAVASIFTGLYVGGHGLDREDRALPPQPVTMAGAFRAAGYRTGAFVANHLLGGRFGFDRGFQAWNPGEPTLFGAPAAAVVERALRWVDGGSGPFLIYVHTMEPHAPYTPSAEDEAPFDLPRYSGDRDTRALLRLGQLGKLPPEGLRFLRARYEGEVRQNDRAFGAILDGLRARGLLERSVVVFTADHGEEFLEHGGTEHTKTLYQELVHLPLAIRLPSAVRGGTRDGEPFQQIDLLPTLLALAGVPAPAGLSGRDLSARLLGDDSSGEATPLLFSEERFEVVDKFAARAGAMKLILNNDGPELWRAGTHLELYDLARDPAEKANLAASRPIVTAFLSQRLDAFRRAQEAARARAGSNTVPLSPEEKEQLRALGYVR